MDKAGTSTHTDNARNGHADGGHVPAKATATTTATGGAAAAASRNCHEPDKETTMATATTRPWPQPRTTATARATTTATATATAAAGSQQPPNGARRPASAILFTHQFAEVEMAGVALWLMGLSDEPTIFRRHVQRTLLKVGLRYRF